MPAKRGPNIPQLLFDKDLCRWFFKMETGIHPSAPVMESQLFKTSQAAMVALAGNKLLWHERRSNAT